MPSSKTKVVQVYSHDFTLAEVNTQYYIGADGGLNVNPASVPIFDLSQFEAVHCFLRTIGTAGSSPIIGLTAIRWDQLAPHPGFSHDLPATNLAVPGDGGGLLYMGKSGSNNISNAGTAGINSGPLVIGPPALWAQFQITVAGTLTGLTAARVRIYGVEAS